LLYQRKNTSHIHFKKQESHMRQRHPLENASLAPYGFVFSGRKERLEYLPQDNPHWVNEERLIARLWDKVHRLNAPKPLPITTIVHKILPSFHSCDRLERGDFVFDGLPYLSRDILILSSTLQWFGTNVGRDFLTSDYLLNERIEQGRHEQYPVLLAEPPGSHHSSREEPPLSYHPSREFILKLWHEEHCQGGRDMVPFFVHACTPTCRERADLLSPLPVCQIDKDHVRPRDRAVVHGLMFWLGTKDGRSFLGTLASKKERAWLAARSKFRTAHGLPPIKLTA
jgi:hypothetical protein